MILETERLRAPAAVMSATFGMACICPCPTHFGSAIFIGLPLAAASFFFPEIRDRFKAHSCHESCKCENN